MVATIVEGIVAVLSYFSAWGIDKIVGRWTAYFTIALEQIGTERAKAAFDETMVIIKDKSPEKAKAWADWRARAANTSPTP